MKASADSWPAVSRILAAAFANDPVFGWLIADDASRRERLERYFAIEARDIALAHGWSEAAGEGVALVLPPGEWRTPLRVQALRAPAYGAVFGRRLPRALGVLTQMERRHPREAHVYFPYIGVAPVAQGRGLGAALMRPVLERCDREGLPAYLEASNPRCVHLYERLGFVGDEEIRPLGSPPIRLMRREPAA